MKEKKMEAPSKIWTACEVLKLISDYARLCEAYNVSDPEMSGLAETCTLVRQHLEKLKSEEDTERTDSM